MIIDMHNHTDLYSVCSLISPKNLVELYINNNIDGLCITEHNYLWTVDEQNKLINRYKGKIKIFFGIEVNTDVGHVLLFGSNNHYYGDITLKDLIKSIDRKKTALIWAHPLRWKLYKDVKINKALVDLFDAVELYNGNLTNNIINNTMNTFNPFNVKYTGGSDTHATEMANKYATKFNESFDTLEGLIENLKNSSYKPVVL